MAKTKTPASVSSTYLNNSKTATSVGALDTYEVVDGNAVLNSLRKNPGVVGVQDEYNKSASHLATYGQE